MRTMLRVLVLLIAVAPLSSFAYDPIKNLENLPVPIRSDGGKYTAGEVKAAIIQGCKAKGWMPTLPEPNKVVASILVRNKHFAEVEIPFTPSSYSILYRSSKNLDYDEKHKKIHGNYNKWVANLSQSIQLEFSKVR